MQMITNTEKRAAMSEPRAPTPEKTVDSEQQAKEPEQQLPVPPVVPPPGKVAFTKPQAEKLRAQYPKYVANKKVITKIIEDLVKNEPLFAVPDGRSQEKWKTSIKRWFQNQKQNQKNKNKTSKAHDAGIEEVAEANDGEVGGGARNMESDASQTEVSSVKPEASTSTRSATHLTTAQTREIYKNFASFMKEAEVTTGLDEFRADPIVLQQVEIMVSAEDNNCNVITSRLWKKLKATERQQWEEKALQKVNIKGNQEAFLRGLRLMLAGCVRFGHIGKAQASVVLSFEDPDKAGEVYTKRFVECWDYEFKGLYEIEDEIDEYVKPLSEQVLADTLVQGLPLKVHYNLQHDIPQDQDGKARFPELDLDVTTLPMMKGIYLDFMCCVWRQANYEGEVDYEAILMNADQFYDSLAYPHVSIIPPNSKAPMFGLVGSELHEHHSLSGTAFEFKPAGSNEAERNDVTSDNPSNDTSAFDLPKDASASSKMHDLDPEHRRDQANEPSFVQKDANAKDQTVDHRHKDVSEQEQTIPLVNKDQQREHKEGDRRAEGAMFLDEENHQVDETQDQEEARENQPMVTLPSTAIPAPEDKEPNDRDPQIEDATKSTEETAVYQPIGALSPSDEAEGDRRVGKKRKARGGSQSEKPTKAKHAKLATENHEPKSSAFGKKTRLPAPSLILKLKPVRNGGSEEVVDGEGEGNGKGKKNYFHRLEPADKKGSVQITPKKGTVEGRVSTRGMAAKRGDQ
ncbi:hypothetical protein V5O48_003636 [Marasmius crinis-equi]|uniref:Uncharacterized protein n=1 Tax=Marasmius crinis-equi TaxID=585013 RepID=A0ABR3FSS6_9AGAR